jgi:hypothetical protein
MLLQLEATPLDSLLLCLNWSGWPGMDLWQLPLLHRRQVSTCRPLLLLTRRLVSARHLESGRRPLPPISVLLLRICSRSLPSALAWAGLPSSRACPREDILLACGATGQGNDTDGRV